MITYVTKVEHFYIIILRIPVIPIFISRFSSNWTLDLQTGTLAQNDCSLFLLERCTIESDIKSLQVYVYISGHCFWAGRCQSTVLKLGNFDRLFLAICLLILALPPLGRCNIILAFLYHGFNYLMRFSFFQVLRDSFIGDKSMTCMVSWCW